MSKKNNFLCFVLILFFFTQYCNENCNEKLPNPFGKPAAELDVPLGGGKIEKENILFDFPEPEDELYTTDVVTETETETQTLESDLFYIKKESLFEVTMLPKEGHTVTIMFDASARRDEKPRIIFEPTFFGNEGRVELAPLSRVVFSGDGIIEVRNGVTFDLSSAQLVLEKGATLHVVPNATVTFVNHKPIEDLGEESEEIVSENNQDDMNDQRIIGSQESIKKTKDNSAEQKKAMSLLNESELVSPGQLILCKGGKVLLDNPSHLIFGSCSADTIVLKADLGQFIVDNENALVSFQQGMFDILFENFSRLQILAGTVELNMRKGVVYPGFIRTWHFQTGAMFEIKNADHGLGLLSLSANNACHEKTDFDNQTSFVRGNGNICFKAFNDSGEVTVHSTVQLQPHLFEQKGSMLDIFLSLACIDVPGTKKTARKVKLVQQGNIVGGYSGQLAAIAPAGDGSIIPLLSGDHKMVYDSNEPGGLLNVIRGYDARNKLFVIDNGKRYS